jgi:hypothetical protein
MPSDLSIVHETYPDGSRAWRISGTCDTPEKYAALRELVKQFNGSAEPPR